MVVNKNGTKKIPEEQAAQIMQPDNGLSTLLSRR